MVSFHGNLWPQPYGHEIKRQRHRAPCAFCSATRIDPPHPSGHSIIRYRHTPRCSSSCNPSIRSTQPSGHDTTRYGHVALCSGSMNCGTTSWQCSSASPRSHRVGRHVHTPGCSLRYSLRLRFRWPQPLGHAQPSSRRWIEPCKPIRHYMQTDSRTTAIDR